MKLLVLIAASLAYAQCQIPTTWFTNTVTYANYPGYFGLNMVQSGDWAYTTIFTGTQDPTNTQWHIHAIGFRAYANVTTQFNVNVLNLYQMQFLITITLFDITPYKQVIRWYRPEFAIMQYMNGLPV